MGLLLLVDVETLEFYPEEHGSYSRIRVARCRLWPGAAKRCIFRRLSVKGPE